MIIDLLTLLLRFENRGFHKVRVVTGRSFHRHGMADPAVFSADAAAVILVLQGLDIVTIPVQLVCCRVNCMGRSMAGFTHHHIGVIVTEAIKIVQPGGPAIEPVGGLGIGSRKIHMAVETVRFVDPRGSGIDFIQGSHFAWTKMSHQPCRTWFAVFLLLF